MNLEPTFWFHRPALAKSIAAGLAGEGLADFSSGLFLAAPRGTGKTTFIKRDLLPECDVRGWLPVHVELGVDRRTDAGLLIEKGIMQVLSEHESALKKAVEAHCLYRRVLTENPSQPELPVGVTLADALTALYAATGRLVVLIVDEAQHMLNSERGIGAMFGLKAARDALNLGRDVPGLRLVFTGSSRDKLTQLVVTRDQPFFGATVTSFPLLGNDYVEAFTSDRNSKLAADNFFKVEDVKQAFVMVGHRPEVLRRLMNIVALDLGQAASLGELLKRNAIEEQASVFTEYEAAYDPLPPLQKAILHVMADDAYHHRPFTAYSADTRQRVGEYLAALCKPGKPSAQRVQRGLALLRNKEMVWKTGKGSYALEESGMADWLLKIRDEGKF